MHIQECTFITLSAQHSGHMSALAAVDSKIGG